MKKKISLTKKSWFDKYIERQYWNMCYIDHNCYVAVNKRESEVI